MKPPRGSKKEYSDELIRDNIANILAVVNKQLCEMTLVDVWRDD